MTDILRPSPRHKRASLFVTCLVDHLYPQTGIALVEILERLGVAIDFPMAQTCCGQPAFNAGFWPQAREVAAHFLDVFQEAELIITPSGSCASMLRHYYPELFKDDPRLREKAAWVAAITWEFTEYLVDGLGVVDLGGALPPTKVAFHQACHGLRLMHLHTQGRQLAQAVRGVQVMELPGAAECCGFGGLFAVKMPEISGAMLNTKLANIAAAGADFILTGDSGCLAQIKGGLSRQQQPQQVMHIAEFLRLALV